MNFSARSRVELLKRKYSFIACINYRQSFAFSKYDVRASGIRKQRIKISNSYNIRYRVVSSPSPTLRVDSL